MSAGIFAAGMIIGIMLAAPVGPLALICIQRAVARGGMHGLASGLGIAVVDAVYAGIVALGLTLVSGFLLQYQLPLRTLAGTVLLFIGCRVFSAPAGSARTLQEGEATLFGAFSSMAGLTAANIFTIITIGIFLSGSGIVISSASPVYGLVFAGGVFTGETAWWLVACTLLGSITHRISPSGLTLINRVSGIIIVLAGLALILSLFLL